MNLAYKRFDSPEDYAAYLSGIPASKDSGSNWSGGDKNSSIRKLLDGDTANLAAAQAIIDKLELDHIFSREVPVLVPSVVGFVPNVPAAIAGHPETMFNRGYVESPSLTSPLTVYVETCVSAGVSQSQLLARGVAVLAFVMAMELVRPVDLYCISVHSHNSKPGVYGAVTKIASRPMDLGRAVWMLTNTSYARTLCFSAVDHQVGLPPDSGPWCFNSNPKEEKYTIAMRKLLDMQPDDVLLKGGYLFDRLMLDDPVQWVSDMIKKHSEVSYA